MYCSSYALADSSLDISTIFYNVEKYLAVVDFLSDRLIGAWRSIFGNPDVGLRPKKTLHGMANVRW